MTLSLSYFSSSLLPHFAFFFFFNDTATTEIYTLSLHDALPISFMAPVSRLVHLCGISLFSLLSTVVHTSIVLVGLDRKSTRLNSSHANISYAVFCLKKKKHRLV